MLFTTFDKYMTVRKGAIHVGAHEGQERTWYKEQGFSPVIWFEPNKDLFPTLLQNLHLFKDQRAYNVGVHDTITGKATLHISSNNGESSSILDLGLHKEMYRTIKYIGDQEIELVRMDEFLKTNKIDINIFNYLSIDVQGVELNVIKSFGKLLGKLDYLYLEVNTVEMYKNCSLLPDVDKYVGQFGFIRMAITLQKDGSWGDAFYKRY